MATRILLGWYFETSARRRAGAALQALLAHGAKDVFVAAFRQLRFRAAPPP